MTYEFYTDNEVQAVNAVRRGKMTRKAAAEKYHVERNTLNALCRAQGIKATLGRPRKKK